MTDQSTSETENPPAASGTSIHWMVAAFLAVLALAGGIFLGRAAFVENSQPSPKVVKIVAEDKDLKVGGEVEFIPGKDVYKVTVRNMPPPPDGKVFAVWMQNEEVTVCAGILNPNSFEFAFAAYDGRYRTLLVTEEDAPYCGDEPTSDPLVTADLTDMVVPEE